MRDIDKTFDEFPYEVTVTSDDSIHIEKRGDFTTFNACTGVSEVVIEWNK